MYTYTGFAKLPGSTWHDGSALYYSLSDASYARLPVLMDSLLTMGWVQWLTRLATWISIGWEVLFIPLVLVRRTRWLALGVGALFHLGIFATIDVAMFSLVSLWGYLAWADPKWLGDTVERYASRVEIAPPETGSGKNNRRGRVTEGQLAGRRG